MGEIIIRCIYDTSFSTGCSKFSFSWEDLLSLLRDELQEYGGLIGLLSAQQQSILNRRTDSLMELNQSVQTQMEASQILHKRREEGMSPIWQNYTVNLKILH